MTWVAEVLPLATTKSIPGTSAWVADVVERHSAPVSVINVLQLVLSRPARPLRSTCLVLVRYEVSIRGDDAPLLGLVLKHTTHTRRINDANSTASGITTPDAHWLGPVASLDDGFAQRVDTEAILDARVRALLFPATVG